MNNNIKKILLQVKSMEGEDGDILPSLYTEKEIENFSNKIINEIISILDNVEDENSINIILPLKTKILNLFVEEI